MMIGYFLFGLAHANTNPSQTLVYDLSIKGLAVGSRTVTITYIPASEKTPLGGRKIKSFTELEASINGKKVTYVQRTTAQISERFTKNFVSTISINGNVTELQGKQKKDGTWAINQVIGNQVTKKEFSRNGLHAFSLELFDPGQLSRWQDGEKFRFLPTETGMLDVFEGEWSEQGQFRLSNQYESISGQKLKINTQQGVLEALWSTSGLLIDWSISISGVRVDADIRNIPKPPEFGEIGPIKSFGGVEEEEL